jgi:hypothetical protein
MGPPNLQIPLSRVLRLAAEQHGVVTRAQLLELGMRPGAIRYGLTPLRFTHAQVLYESGHVREVLGAVASRLAPRALR